MKEEIKKHLKLFRTLSLQTYKKVRHVPVTETDKEYDENLILFTDRIYTDTSGQIKKVIELLENFIEA